MRIVDVRERIGRTIDDTWRVDALLGRGGTSTVFAVTNVRDGARAALKVLHPELSRDPVVVRIFLAEARNVAAIDHPGILRMFADGTTEEGEVYLLSELLVGQTLEDLRQDRGGRIPLDEVMRIGHAVMDTLVAVHAAGVVHRDLKPQNIFVLEGEGVKLLDFGVAKLKGKTVDAAQSIVGTPSFMPPEQALGMNEKVDEKSDVWSLGATLFQVLSGQPVHIARHMNAMMLATASARPRSLADAAPELPRAVAAVVDRAIAYRKIERWNDVAEMRRAWLGAHPHWLPTLPPPSFIADPDFVDADLVPGKTTGMFDPRELLRELAPPGLPTIREKNELDTISTSVDANADAKKRGARMAIFAAAAIVVALSIVGVVAAKRMHAPTPPASRH